MTVRAGKSQTYGLFSGLAALLLFLAGCATPQTPEASATALAERLQQLSPRVSPAEASLAAGTAHAYSLEMARDYRLVRPAFFHNVLVNTGLRSRGLCFQLADDLSAKLRSLDLQTIRLRRAIAREATRREHSSVVLTAPDQPFSEGIVLDAWRHSGHLFWGSVEHDRYPWTEQVAQTPGNAPSEGPVKSAGRTQ